MARPSDYEVLVRTRAWLEKAVIGLNLCPFAKAVYTRDFPCRSRPAGECSPEVMFSPPR
jgi:hypothetical protein